MKKAKASEGRLVHIREEPIELAQFLKFAGVADTGGRAKQAIVDGEVTLNGAVETRKGKKLVAGDKVAYAGEMLVVAVE